MSSWQTFTSSSFLCCFDYVVECPRLWCITKHSIHNEGIHKKVNSEPIFFWLQLIMNYSWFLAVCKNQSWLFCSCIIFGANIEISGIKSVKKPHFFFTFGSKKSKFERKKSEIPKTQKLLENQNYQLLFAFWQTAEDLK